MEWDEDLYKDLRDDGNDNDNFNDICRSRNINDFMSHEDFLRSINITVNISRGELFLMIIKQSLKHRRAFSDLSEIMQLMNRMFSQLVLPETRWILNNILNSKNNLEYHGICPVCCKYIGEIVDLKSSVTCDVCSEVISFDNPSCSNIFILIDPTENIKLLLQEEEKYYEYIVKDRKYDGKLRDIFDGKCYRAFRKNLPTNENYYYVTSIFNTDGAPRFESSNYSVWPIYLQLNEIPVETRLKRIITCGLWFGKNKPEMTAFLQPFTNIMNRLSNDGIRCTINNEERLIKVYVLVCCVDTVARAPMQGIKLFNGKYGCNWCLHKGEYYEHSMRYTIQRSLPEKRTKENMIEFMRTVTKEGCNGDIYGVLCTSPLINLHYFDVVQGFVPDYMHCCLAGVAKQITKCFLNIIPTPVIDELNEILLEIKVPHQIGRSTRSFKDMKQWKAREWENFTLYYSVPLFQIALSKEMLEYWILFVESLHKLLSTDINIDELNEVDKKLHKFVFLTEKLFHKVAMTYNIHQLLHIAESVLNWGPLYCHSTYSFESANHDTLQAIHCAKGVNLQIVRYINMQHSVHLLRKNTYPHASPLVVDYCEELSTRRIKKSSKLSLVTYLGNSTLLEEHVLGNFGVSPSTLAYERAVKDGYLLMSSKRKNQRSDNSFALLANGTFIRIFYFLESRANNKEITLCNIVNTSTSVCNHLSLVQSIESGIVAVDTKEIVQVCVFIKVRENSYIARLPNLHHY